jgi:hypothetical protein
MKKKKEKEQNGNGVPPEVLEKLLEDSTASLGEVIYAYTRSQAIEDGVLVDVTETAAEVGFKYPTAVTAALWADIENIPEFYVWEEPNGRLWDILWVAASNARSKARKDAKATRFTFEVILHTGPTSDEKDWPIELVFDCGPGDQGEPVLTIGYASDF